MTRHLILIGLPGSGKTTVGRLAAERLGLPFADCDTLIQRETGMTIPAIFAERGEPYFRAVESRILAALCGGPAQVIATGGGAGYCPMRGKSGAAAAAAIHAGGAGTAAAGVVSGLRRSRCF
mgnify:CR=1 FL=1